MAELDDALITLTSWLNSQRIPYMVIGGFAVTVWGEPRFTRDLDVTISVPAEGIEPLIESVSIKFTTLVSDPSKFVSQTRVLPIALDPRVEELAEALSDRNMLDWYRDLRKRWTEKR